MAAACLKGSLFYLDTYKGRTDMSYKFQQKKKPEERERRRQERQRPAPQHRERTHREEPQGMQREDIVIGRNGVIELLKSGRAVESILITSGEQGGSIVRIVAMAKEQGIPIKETSPVKLDHMCGKQNHQGVIAVTGAAKYAELEDIYARAGDDPLFVVIADDITDPHNLGAIIRTAETAGAHGIIIPKRGGVGLTVTVAKTSAGAAEHLPVVRVSNLAATVEELKKKGVWVYGTDMEGTCWCEIDYSGPVALVIGSEGKGMSRLLTEKCDFIASLPMYGEINSLNASVAAGIVLYEIARQRAGIRAK